MTTDTPPEDTQALLAQARADYEAEAQAQADEAESQWAPTNGKVDLVSAALVLAQGAIKPAEFDATNPFFKSKYATLGSVIAASREALCKSGLAVLQVPTIQGDLVSVHTRIVHKSGQSLDCGVMSLSLGESDRNSDAQLAGSILTYLKRYAWASILGIYADADDDGNSGPKGAIPRQATQRTPALPLSAPVEATPQQRMKALNQLKAAPGQDNRNMLSHFMFARGWIAADQTPDDWPLAHVPTTQKAFMALQAEVEHFHMELAQGQLQEEQS